MASPDFDPHNHAPPVSADDEWADAHGAVDAFVAPRSTLPEKRVSPLPEAAPERSRSRPEMGVQIDVERSLRRAATADSAPEPGASDQGVVKLEALSSETGFQARQTIAAPADSQEEVPKSFHDGARARGRQSKISNRWIAASAGGVVLVVVVALVGHERWIRESKSTPLPVVEVPKDEPLAQVAGFELESSSETEARELLARYAQATRSADVLPLIRNPKSVAARLPLDWQPWAVPADWQPPIEASWSASAGGGRNHGLLRGIKPDFTKFRVYFVREDDGLRIDWEATQGIGDASFEILQRGRGTGGKMRVFAKLENFYTLIFPEESYHSFRLLAPDGEQAIWGYSRLGSPADVRLMEVFEPGVIRAEGKSELPVTVRLEPGPEGCQKNQWLIGEMLHIEWVSP